MPLQACLCFCFCRPCRWRFAPSFSWEHIALRIPACVALISCSMADSCCRVAAFWAGWCSDCKRVACSVAGLSKRCLPMHMQVTACRMLHMQGDEAVCVEVPCGQAKPYIVTAAAAVGYNPGFCRPLSLPRHGLKGVPAVIVCGRP